MSFAVTSCENKAGEHSAGVETGGIGGDGEELLFAEAIFRSKDLT